MADVTSVVSGTGKSIGRYFSVVSVLPSMFLVIYVFLLASSGSWRHSPNWHDAFLAVRNLGLAGAALLAVGGIAVALVLHPLQFSMVQLLEGYWGPGRLAQQIRVSRIRRHIRRRKRLLDAATDARSDLAKLEPEDEEGSHPGADPDAVVAPRAGTDSDAVAGSDARAAAAAAELDLKAKLLSQRDEAARSARGYPDDPAHTMPTRLGNMLRRYEFLAGFPYNLDAPTVLPCLALVAPPQHLDYLNDQRSALDLAARTSMTSVLAFLATLVFLWHSGLWLLISLIPYGVAYAAYRGSVVAAQSYGIAITAIIALNRFALYDYMRMPRPSTTVREREMNKTLMYLLRYYDDKASLIYGHPR
jgi:hypothetical protein